MEAPWLGVAASYKTEDAANICRLSVGSNFNTERALLHLSPTIGRKHDSSQHNGTVKGLIIAPIICIITMFF